jgi:crossover junction endodeoxyribonuclease RusA
VLPFEFTVQGPPVSQQTRNRSRLHSWKATVQSRAAGRWPAQSPPLTQQLRAVLVYYYDGEPLDTDNMVKPILDALKGLVYEDDSQIDDTDAHRRSLNGSFQVRGMSPALAEGFVAGREFVYVRVEECLNPEVLP